MKNRLKQTIAILVAMALTISGVMALASSVSAATGSEPVGYTINHTEHDFNHDTTIPSDPDVTYPSDDYPTIIPFYDRYITASIAFKNGELSNDNFTRDSNQRYRMYLTLKNVTPGSYEFVIPYNTFDGGWYVEGIKTDGNGDFETTGGNWFAFRVDMTCDVTVEWDVYDGYVGVDGYSAYILNSTTPFEGVDESGTSSTSEEIITNPPTEPTEYDPHGDYEILDIYDNFSQASISFKNNKVRSVVLEEDENNDDIICSQAVSIPASNEPYYFVINYKLIHASGIYYFTKTDGNSLYQDGGGKWFSFYKTTDGNVTFTWHRDDPNRVDITGAGVIPMKSQIPYSGTIEDSFTEPYTYPVVTYPESVPNVSSEVIATTTPSATYEKGDVNMDSKVNINDVTMIQRFLVKSVTLNDNQQKLADVSGDGIVSIKDGTLIQKKIAKMNV